MNRKIAFQKSNTAKIISLLILVALAMIFAFQVKAQTLRFNWMSGDQETLRLKNDTKGTSQWIDPVSADAGDWVRFNVYYHCGWDSSAWPTEKAQNTTIRITFPTDLRTTITSTARISATNISAVSDNGTINVSSSQKLDFENTAQWHRLGTIGDVAVVLGSGYAQANIGDIGCDCTGCYNNAGFVIFKAKLSGSSSPNLTISKLVKNITDATSFVDSVSADPSDEIEFKILVTSAGTDTAYNVIVDDVLPTKITYQGNLKIDGVSSAGDILSGINIGSLAPNQSKTITFEAKVKSEENFSEGTTTLENKASARADNVSRIYDSAFVKVIKSSSNPLFDIEKTVQNLTKGHTTWYEVATAKPSDKVRFKIKVTSTGDETAKSIIVKDILPEKISWHGNLEIDGQSSDNEITDGINIGNLAPDQSKIITFDALLASKEDFPLTSTTLTNTAKAYNVDLTVSDTAKVIVGKTPTEIPTGIFNSLSISLGITVLVTLIVSYVLLFRFYYINHVLDLLHTLPEERAKRKLTRIVAKIKRKEGEKID